jgi:transcriptional antiterminator NusG
MFGKPWGELAVLVGGVVSDESQKPWEPSSAEASEMLRAAASVHDEFPPNVPLRSEDTHSEGEHAEEVRSPEAAPEQSSSGPAHDTPAHDAPQPGHEPHVEAHVPEPSVAVAEDQAGATTAGTHETNGAKRAPEASSPEGTAVTEEPAADDAGETTEESPPKSSSMDWYILKVQSNREESIRDGLLRRVKIAGLDYFFDEVVVPTETVSEYKDGKRRTRKQKIWPGYIVVHMEINEDTWFLVRETPGIGDFTGAGGKPTAMKAAEVEKILKLVHPEKHAAKEKTPVKIAFQIGDRVKIKEGTFQNFDGEVGAIDHANGRVTVITEIFNRKTPVELDYWQVERI